MSADSIPARGNAALGADGTPDRDRVREVLRERARALARPPAPPPPVGALEILTFDVAQERCAVESRFVHAVFRLAELTPLPGAVAPIAGVTAWRGEVLTLLDVRSMLGAGDQGERLAHVIVIGGVRPVFGLLAADLQEVALLPRAELLTGVDATQGREAVAGVTRAGLVLLDAERLLGTHFGSTNT